MNITYTTEYLKAATILATEIETAKTKFANDLESLLQDTLQDFADLFSSGDSTPAERLELTTDFVSGFDDAARYLRLQMVSQILEFSAAQQLAIN